MAYAKEKLSGLKPEFINGIHELELEGIEITDSMIDDFLLYSQQKISKSELMQRALGVKVSPDE